MFQEWIQNIVVFLLFMTLIGQVVPSEKYQKYVRLTMGMILIFVMLMPLTEFFGMDVRMYQNFIQESLHISAMDAKISGQMFDSEKYYNESYRTMVCETIEAYFEENSMNVAYCKVDINEDRESENYGAICSIEVGLFQKDKIVEQDSKKEGVRIEKIQIDSLENTGKTETAIPEQKIKEWRNDLSKQFGVEGERLKLEILS